MPTWNEFAWSVFIYKYITNEDSSYQNLMSNTQFLNSLRTAPNSLQANRIQNSLIKCFLNTWGSRVENTTSSAINIQTTLNGLLPYLNTLNNLTIQTVNFGNTVTVNNNQMTIEDVIAYCYDQVKNNLGSFRFGDTATSKLLHILQPELFVMWDNYILKYYNQIDQQVSGSGQGYVAYLKIMQQMAQQVIQNFHTAYLNPPAGANQNPANYLSTQLGYSPPKTLAKYLDEYNWVKITKNIHTPPQWHP